MARLKGGFNLIRKRIGLVKGIAEEGNGLVKLIVDVDGEEVKALNYKALTGPVYPGDRVLLNNTALHLSLGTGGADLVYHNYTQPLPPFVEGGHIMKLRYTPGQIKVLSCEEKEAGNQEQLEKFKHLAGMPVLIGELHSMLVPSAAVIKYYKPGCRLVYLMTDGGALPLSFSANVLQLKQKGLIDASITCGHAFGGDLEAVNIYSGLAAASSLLQADAVILTMGPGHVGTGTRLGFSGLEVGDHVNRVNAMQGTPIVIPRLSCADPRRRHRGVSHHTITALKLAACTPARLVLPRTSFRQMRKLLASLSFHGLQNRHRLLILKPPPLQEIIESYGLDSLKSMGRYYCRDPLFFDSAGAAAMAVLHCLENAKITGKQTIRR